MPTLNIHRANGSLFEKLPLKDLSPENLAKLFHVAQCRDQEFYGIVASSNGPLAMIYCGETKNIIRVVFCSNHTNHEINVG